MSCPDCLTPPQLLAEIAPTAWPQYRVTLVIATEEPYQHPEDVGCEVVNAVDAAYGDRSFRVATCKTEVMA